MGEVFLAEDLVLGRQVAVKKLLADPAEQDGVAAQRLVREARSAALIPVVMPSAASTETVNAVPKRAVFSSACGYNPRASHFSAVSGRQISPRPYFAMKLMISGVTFWAAQIRSPSFSRSSSSTRMTIRPAFSSATISGMVAMLISILYRPRSAHGGGRAPPAFRSRLPSER